MRRQSDLEDIMAARRDRLPELREYNGVRSLGIFGSFVRGEAGTEHIRDLIRYFGRAF